MFRASQRMAGHKMHTFRQVRGDRVDHLALDRTYICHRHTGCQMRCDLFGHSAHHTHGYAKNDKVRTVHGLSGAVADHVTQPDTTGRVARGF